jgi:hypothetical protein
MPARPKNTRLCQLPSPGNIAGRSSSITNAFFNSVIPIHSPRLEEEHEALSILGMEPDDIRCAYCGDPSTEWDHLRPLIEKKEPTGFITEIANLVPACGKCNQSKGNKRWQDWIVSSAVRSPKSRGVPNLDIRIMHLNAYQQWRKPVWVDFDKIVHSEKWEKHKANCATILSLLRESQILAKEIRETVSKAHEKRS